VAQKGQMSSHDIVPDYVEHLLGYLDLSSVRPLKLVVNAGNGAAGHVIDALEARFAALSVPIEFIKVHHQPDGTFPNGIPNPILTENRAATRDAVLAHGADMGIAWDGDFDRCFLFDARGEFIEGYYIVGLLAQAFLVKAAANQSSGEKIIHDPRLVWNTIDIVEQAGGQAIQCKTGHAFIKERMRLENAVYGGEMSAHHYFRDFAYCDSGMVPWLLVVDLLSKTGKPLAALVDERIALYPCSGEINFKVADSQTAIAAVVEHFAELNPAVDQTDGIALDFGDWRLSIRASNTEPLLRLNVEARGDGGLQRMQQRTAEIQALIQR